MSFGSLHIGLTGVLGHQSALTTIGHNLTNMNTEGYNRQRVVFASNQALRTTTLQFGQGVNISEIQRIHDEYLQSTIRNTLTKTGEMSAKDFSYQEIEMLFNETDGLGLNDAMTKFWNSWSDLANSPTDTSAEAASKRSNVVQSTEYLINTIKTTRSDLEHMQTQASTRITSMVGDVNAMLDSLASLNTQIGKMGAMGNPSFDLLDKRDNLLNELASLIEINVDVTPDGQAAVFFAGKTLVDRSHASKLQHQITGNSEGKLLYVGPNYTEDITQRVTSGKIGAYLEVRDKMIPGYVDKIDELASGLIQTVNKAHSSGLVTQPFGAVSTQYFPSNSRTQLNQSNIPFPIQNGSFQMKIFGPNGEEVGTHEIRVNATDSLHSLAVRMDGIDGLSEGGQFSVRINNQNQMEIQGMNGHTFAFFNDSSNALVALGLNTFFTGNDSRNIDINSYVKHDASKLATSITGQPGDNQNANVIAELRNSLAMSKGSVTFDEFYNSFVGKVGLDTLMNRDSLEANAMVAQQLNLRRESFSGVNENEELTNMLKFQRAFEASARFITTIDGLLDKIVNQMGR
ncbi:flagellar hook-associated protein FlgK [Chrysiogenes arsenatis]|uniref:flagellar hook-associated protein FlgK n=1 Tax=Chrysiogenes arsenatis TaxID=309797 RepID=UPI0004000562|nr:flagellar hook-associated protein FlgK [Chrysiogenes arsenatis]